MKIPKYIKEKIKARYKAQCKANDLQYEIEQWFIENGIDIGEYYSTHICLYTEPLTVMKTHLKILESEEIEE